jgi:beta-N-acetylhexosaminidase
MSADQRIMLDLAGTALEPDDRRRLLHASTAALILFARNFESQQQVVELIAEIRSLRQELLVAVDHEGGRVQRFKGPGFTALPPMARLGEIWHESPAGPGVALGAAHAVGYVMSRELRACDVDFSFAPVLDLDFGQSAVIGTRAFAASAAVVARLARALIAGMAQGGMANCGKHFPGHGFAEADSHIAVPVDGRCLEEIRKADMEPYAELQNALLAIMPAHVIYSQIDPRPAGFSQIWLQQILRSEMGFEGAIFSDDLAMEGAHVAGDVVARGHAALSAGCDMVLICNRPDEADVLLEHLHFAPDERSFARIRRMAGAHPPGLRDPAADPVYSRCRAAIEQLV